MNKNKPEAVSVHFCGQKKKVQGMGFQMPEQKFLHQVLRKSKTAHLIHC